MIPVIDSVRRAREHSGRAPEHGRDQGGEAGRCVRARMDESSRPIGHDGQYSVTVGLVWSRIRVASTCIQVIIDQHWRLLVLTRRRADRLRHRLHRGRTHLRAARRGPRPHHCLWSAKTQSRTGRREGVFVMQSAEDRIGTDGIRFPVAMARTGLLVVAPRARRIGNTRTQRRVRAPGIVMGDP